MKNCPDCGTAFEDVFDECPACAENRYEAAPVRRGAKPVSTKTAPTPTAPSRPTGQNAIGGGVLAIVIGLILLFAGDSMSSSFFVGVGLMNIGVIALVAGYIVSAISWLPGRDDH